MQDGKSENDSLVLKTYRAYAMSRQKSFARPWPLLAFRKGMKGFVSLRVMLQFTAARQITFSSDI